MDKKRRLIFWFKRWNMPRKGPKCLICSILEYCILKKNYLNKLNLDQYDTHLIDYDKI